MKITKDKKNTHLYQITGLTRGQLMALHNVLELSYQHGTLTAIVHDCWIEILLALNTQPA